MPTQKWSPRLVGATLLMIAIAAALVLATPTPAGAHPKHHHRAQAAVVQTVEANATGVTLSVSWVGKKVGSVTATQPAVDGVSSQWQFLVLRKGNVVWSYTTRTPPGQDVLTVTVPRVAGDTVIFRAGYSPSITQVSVTR